MSKLSIIIPSHNEPYLNRTVRDILNKAKDNIEILVNIDGDMPKRIVKDKRVNYTHHQKPIGMRGGINLGLEKAKSKYIMKTDAHCSFAKGFDTVLKKDCKENWLMIPRRYSLNIDEWTKSLKGLVWDYHYLCYPPKHRNRMVPVDWRQKTRERNKPEHNIDDTMTFQGSFWFAHRDYFMKKVGYLDKESYGSFGGEQVEIGLKYWLSGGKVKVNKKTWYAHFFKNREFYNSNRKLLKNKKNLIRAANYEWIAKHWTNDEEPKMMHKFSWLVEKFWPVPEWPKDKKLWKMDTKKDIKGTPLCKIAEKYGTDKCPKYKHGYTPIYYRLLKDKRNSIKKVIGIGIGYYKDMEVVDIQYSDQTGAFYHKGASLKMWRDFFPHAQIYGADIKPETMFKDKRIKTFVCDETKKEDINKLIKKTGSNIDLFIDDGSHAKDHQTFLAKTTLPLLADKVIYIIEDVTYPNYIVKELKNYNCKVLNGGKRWRDDNLVIIKK